MARAGAHQQQKNHPHRLLCDGGACVNVVVISANNLFCAIRVCVAANKTKWLDAFENRYISSFLGFSPADNPQVMTLILIDEPQGIYYGGTIAAPVVSEIYDNILPYLGIYKDENAEEETTQTISIDDAVF